MFGKLKSVGITKGDYCKVMTHSPTPLFDQPQTLTMTKH